MPWDASKPRPSGKLSLPTTDAGTNKIAPTSVGVDSKGLMLGDKASEEDDVKLLERIRKRMELCVKKESGNRKAALEDRKFKAGDQWPADVAAQRNTDHRPCLTINKLPTFVNQITNNQRANRPAVNVSPIGDKGSKDAAKAFKGMIRHIEREAAADIAFDTAFDDAVSSGFGYWRVVTEYEEPGSFKQVLVPKRIRNPFTVYLDPYHQEPDGSDCRYAFVTERIPREDFDEEYPEADPVPFLEGGAGESFKDWIGKDDIRVAEYYEFKIEMRRLVRLSNGHEGWHDELDDLIKQKIKNGAIKILEEREAECPKLKWYKVNAKQVLDRRDCLDKWIPIFKVIGNEIDIEGDVKISGVIRNAKDPQRMINYWETKMTEAIALVPNAPYIMEEGQIEGHEQAWKNANRKPTPVLQYKGTSLAGRPVPPPQRQPLAGIPAGIQQALQNNMENIIATTGVRFDATKQERMNDESGVAIRQLSSMTDLGSAHYVDNFCRTLRHYGRYMVDMIPKTYDEARVVTILHPDDSEEAVHLDPHQQEAFQEKPMGPNQKAVKSINLAKGKYGVAITTGPSFATRRIEAAESMMDFAKAMPNAAALIMDLIAKYQDWEGAEEMAARLAKAVPANLLTPDQKDITPQVQALIQSLEQQIKQTHEQLQQAMHALQDKGEDREIARTKIEHDFAAKIMAVIEKAETSASKLDLEKARAIIDLFDKQQSRIDDSTASAGASSDAKPSDTSSE